MKKLYSLITAVMLGGAISSAQVTIGETNYETLEAAVSAAQPNDVITINEDVQFSNRLGLDTKNNITIQGAEGKNITVKCRVKNKIGFLVKQTATIKNLNLVYADDPSTQVLFEVSTGNGKLTMENCTISDYKVNSGGANPQTQGVICAKTSGRVTLNNVIFNNNTVLEGYGEIFLGGNNSTISGTTNGSIYMQKGYSFTATNFAPEQPVKLYLQSGAAEGSNIVLGTTDANNFDLQYSGYILEPKDGNLVLGRNVIVAVNETTNVSYNSFMAAYNALAPVDGVENVVLSVRENADVTDRLMNPGSTAYIVVGTSQNITLKRTFTNKLLVSNAANMGFENLTIDCNNQTNNNFEFQANQNDAVLSLKDVKILNSKSTKGIFDVKDGNRVLSLNNVNVEGYNGQIGVNLNGKLQLEGNNVLPAVYVANAGAEISATGTLTNTTPINIIYADGLAPKAGDTVVKGCTDPSKFSIDGMTLQTVDGNLVVGSSSAIDDIAVDEEKGEAVYYNLNGVVVNPENLAPGLYIRRQGSKVTKIVIK